ncbi:MAG TPA: TonB-dependent receptor, partial [Thermoanaerobaculia bacterium]
MALRKIVVSALAILLVALPLLAATYGTVKVKVVDSEGAPIPGATVEATSPVFIGARTEVSDSMGVATLTALVPGKYTVKVSLSGFQTATLTTAAQQNETTEVTARLVMAAMAESITVTAEAPIVETKKSTLSDHVTLEDVEALPISRDYRGYAQLVSGVNVVPNGGGGDTPVDPASKGGNNYRDRDRGYHRTTGGTGSRDNIYYLDGLNITDMTSGTGSMTFNNEVILEQEVITSGVSAEFAGGRGFVGNIVTKSGGNQFSGSINYYLQNADFYDDFKTDDTRLRTNLEDKWDAAATLGGPVWRDHAWFFLSTQQRERSDEVQLSTSASPNGGTEEYINERENFFGKVTFKPWDKTTIIGQFFTDPRTTSGSTDVNTPPNRYPVIEDTPETMSITGQHIFGSAFLVDARYGRFEEEYTEGALHPELGIQNTIVYEAGRSVPAHQRLLGSYGTRFEEVSKKDQYDASATYLLDAMGSHAIKAGLQINEWQDSTNLTFNGLETLSSIANDYSGLTFAEARAKGIFVSDYDYIYTALLRTPTSQAFRAADANGDGTLSKAEYDAIKFTSKNAAGLNFFRNLVTAEGINNVTQNSKVAFLQDDWTFNNFAINLGLRFEDFEYLASDGSDILDPDMTVGPRLGVTYDIGGQGRQKVTAFFGRYHDPLRMDMVHFAGNITGRILDEQIWIGNDWYTYRVRGSRERRDAAFAPNLENQYQDEYSVTYGINLNPTMGFTAQFYERQDKNLIEDYDPYVYFSCCGFDGVYGDTEFGLGPEDFGFGPGEILPGKINFFLANLVGAKRRTRGLDLGLERRFAN